MEGGGCAIVDEAWRLTSTGGLQHNGLSASPGSGGWQCRPTILQNFKEQHLHMVIW